MKKFICLLFALVLCLSVAMAESVPSKTTSDMTEVKDVVAENLPADSNFAVSIPVEEEVVAVANTEVTKLVEAAKTSDVTTYFGTVTDSKGNEVKLTELLETETVNVFEFMPIEVKEYVEEYGSVNVTLTFSTPYAKDEKVVVLLGLVTVNEDGTQTVAWTAYEGLVVEEGAIQVEFDPETLKMIQDGTALIAIVSK